MASDDKKTKTNSAPENEAPPEKKSTSGAEPSKADGGELAAASPSGYSRGEGQKPVSKAYRDNWNVIFAKKRSDNSLVRRREIASAVLFVPRTPSSRRASMASCSSSVSRSLSRASRSTWSSDVDRRLRDGGCFVSDN
jgi:hypothetical protein